MESRGIILLSVSIDVGRFMKRAPIMRFLRWASTVLPFALIPMPVGAFDREDFESGLKEALSLAESGRSDQATGILQRVSGCDIAPDAVPVDRIWKDNLADGIRHALRLIERGDLSMVDHLSRHLAGCHSYVLFSGAQRDARRPNIETMQKQFPPACQAFLGRCLDSARERASSESDYLVDAMHCSHIATVRSFKRDCAAKAGEWAITP